ncbi:MAG: EamA family transporter RarD [Planctomycetota bacterium]
MRNDEHPSARAGVILAGIAFALWGVLPIYWKQLGHVGAFEILLHRFLWAGAAMNLALAAAGRWGEVARHLRDRRTLASLALSAALLGVNGYAFVYGVNHALILECSLGYYIAPLVNVALGAAVLKERLNTFKLVALGLAIAAVANMMIHYGRVPWVALTLALTFGCYGLFRKRSRAGSLDGFAVESGILGLIAAAFVTVKAIDGSGALGRIDLTTDALLIGAGVITLTPLVLFAAGARRIELTTLGFLQYLAPSGALIVGTAIYGEPFTGVHAMSFGLIWAALAIFTWDGVHRASRAAALRRSTLAIPAGTVETRQRGDKSPPSRS